VKTSGKRGSGSSAKSPHKRNGSLPNPPIEHHLSASRSAPSLASSLATPIPRQVRDMTPLGVHGMQQGPRTPPYVQPRYFPQGAYAGPAQPIFQPRFVGCPLGKPTCDGCCMQNGGVHGPYHDFGHLGHLEGVCLPCPLRTPGCDGVCTVNGGLHGLRRNVG